MSRIIAGSRGGRRLVVPTGGPTRPTTDRVREALFSAVTAWAATSDRSAEQSLAGLSFCDLFAGSGAVGLEAASRGAAPVWLVEGNRRTALVTARNAATLQLPVQTKTMRVEELLRGPASAFDVVFADPPYDYPDDSVAGLLAQLVTGGWVQPDGLIIVERSRRSAELVWPEAFRQGWVRRYGDTALHFGSA